MSNKQALEDLRDKVKAGGRNGMGWHKVVSVIGLHPDDRHLKFLDAWDGSIDAAKALHECVLGDGYIGSGYNYTIRGSGKVCVWDVISGGSGFGEVSPRKYHDACVSRAWLLAILGALIEKEVK